VAGCEDGRDLVEQLLVVHRFAALFVAGIDEHAKKVSAGGAGVRALVADGAGDHRAHGLARLGEALVAGQGPAERRQKRPHDALVELVQKKRDGLADVGGFAVDVEPEHGVGHDAQGEVHHRAGDVDGALVLRGLVPLARGGLGELDHARAERPDARAMKRGLRDAALSQPEVAFAGEQAVAEQQAQGVEAGRGLREVFAVIDEQRAHVLGVKQDVPLVTGKLHARDVAALAQAEGQRGERRGAHRVEVLEYRNRPRKLWRAHLEQSLPHRVRHSLPCIHFFKSGVIASRTIAGPMELTTRKP
jgi:hypothetical protein